MFPNASSDVGIQNCNLICAAGFCAISGLMKEALVPSRIESVGLLLLYLLFASTLQPDEGAFAEEPHHVLLCLLVPAELGLAGGRTKHLPLVTAADLAVGPQL